jgi:hypothetical protein
VKKCGRCGGKLRRVHRTFIERLGFMAKYRCKECKALEVVPRPYRFHLGGRCRCHKCGSYRVTRLKVRDKIDPMERGFLNVLEKWAGGRLYHCKFCRIQFWDRRKWAPSGSVAPSAEPVAKRAPDTQRTAANEG